MPEKQVCLYDRDDLINRSENENGNGRILHVNKKYIDWDVNIETNIENIACLGKTMSLRNKQHSSNIWDSIY